MMPLANIRSARLPFRDEETTEPQGKQGSERHQLLHVMNSFLAMLGVPEATGPSDDL